MRVAFAVRTAGMLLAALCCSAVAAPPERARQAATPAAASVVPLVIPTVVPPVAPQGSNARPRAAAATQAIPEPLSAALFAVGFAALACVLRFRKERVAESPTLPAEAPASEARLRATRRDAPAPDERTASRDPSS